MLGLVEQPKQTLTAATVLALIITLLPFGTGIPHAMASTITLTIPATGGDTTPQAGWTFNEGIISVTDTVSISASYLTQKLNDGALRIESVGDIVIEIDTTIGEDDPQYNTDNHPITFAAAGNINVRHGAKIFSKGGDISLRADSPPNGSPGDGTGGIKIGDDFEGVFTTRLDSGGGDITFGGNYQPDGESRMFAGLFTDSAAQSGYSYSVGIFGAAVNAGGGDISIRGSSGDTFNGITWTVNIGGRYGPNTSLVTQGAGSILVHGDGSQAPANPTSSNSRNSWAVNVPGSLTAQAGDITVIGKANTARTNARGHSISGSFTTTTGNILVEDRTTPTNSPNYSGPYLPGITLGSTSGNITIRTDKVSFDNNPTAVTPGGTVTVEPAGDSFAAPFLFLLTVTSDNLVIGKTTNTQNINIRRPINVTNQTVLSSGGAVAQVTDGSPSTFRSLISGSLILQGSGSFNLSNPAHLNNFGTIAAGSPDNRVGQVSIFDVSDGLTIGEAGGLAGVYSTGEVLIETGTGNINLVRNISTTSGSADAVRINAGKTKEPNDETGGDIIVSGSPTLQTGANGIVKMFSGSEAGSTGLTTLVGGSNFVYYGADETSTLTPTPTQGNKYAIYRSTVETPPVVGGSSGGSSGSSSQTPSKPSRPQPVVVEAQTELPAAAPSRVPPPSRVTPVSPSTPPVPQPVARPGAGFNPDAPSRATVGGAPVNVIATANSADRLSVNAGAFRFGVGVNAAGGGQVQVTTPSNSPELFVPRGQGATVTGGGSFPGSFVQLWLPGNGTDAREVARIPVRPDGTFASDIAFGPGNMDLPVPIGRQVLQVVGYDEAGNQTVVDMTINIGQGVPAPEPNRQVGELPALSFGQALATSGGLPETVSITGVPETGSVNVEGSGWFISVNADENNGFVENASGNVLLRLNQSAVATAEGTGFLPGTLATVWLFSDPTLVDTVSVSEDGSFMSEFLVDGRLIAPGEHTLQVQGVGIDGYIKAANLGVLVEQATVTTSESASGLLFWMLGLLLVAIMLVFIILARRRRRQDA